MKELLDCAFALGCVGCFVSAASAETITEVVLDGRRDVGVCGPNVKRC